MFLFLSAVLSFAFSQTLQLDGVFDYGEQVDYNSTAKVARFQSVIMGRVRGAMDLTDSIKGVAQISTSGNGVTSNYESLGGNFADKGITLRLAYVDWAPMDNLHLTLGKIENPFYSPASDHLIWDGDVTLDGLGLKYNYDINDVSVYTNAGAFIVSENGMAVTDEYLFALQAGVKYSVNIFNMNIGMSYYDYTGRTENGMNDMNLLGAYGEFGFDLKFPVMVYMDYNYDSARPTHQTANEAFSMGVVAGKLVNVWDIKTSLAWQKAKNIGYNSSFSDNNFVDASGSHVDLNGFVFKIQTKVLDNLKADLEYYLVADETVDKRNYNQHRVLFDLIFDFNKIF